MHIRLYVKRRENRLHQKDVAKHLNMHPVTYSRKESGDSDFTLSEAKELAKYFDCTLNELFWDQEV